MVLMARPRADIDLAELEKLCALQCTQADLAGWFGVHLHTIENRVKDDTLLAHEGEEMTFHEIMERGYARGRVSLRRRQMENADNGNATMQIWLGKQLLGQRDNLDTRLTGAGDGPLEVNVNSAREQVEAGIARVLARAGAEGDPGRPD